MNNGTNNFQNFIGISSLQKKLYRQLMILTGPLYLRKWKFS